MGLSRCHPGCLMVTALQLFTLGLDRQFLQRERTAHTVRNQPLTTCSISWKSVAIAKEAWHGIRVSFSRHSEDLVPYHATMCGGMLLIMAAASASQDEPLSYSSIVVVIYVLHCRLGGCQLSG